MLYGPDGRPASAAAEAEKPKLFDAKNEPIRRQIGAEDIRDLDPSKPQFIYAKTKDGGPATHGNEYDFYAHELEPSKMREVDPKATYVGSTIPRPLPPELPSPGLKEQVAKHMPEINNRAARRAKAARQRKDAGRRRAH